jgi:hypothetical protein
MGPRCILPTTPLFEDPGFDAQAHMASLDPGAAGFFAQMRGTGGAIIDLGDAARALCDAAVAETDGLFGGRVRLQDAWRRSPSVRALALQPRLHALLAAAYGRRSFPFQTLNFRVGSQQELHSDVIHFSSQPARFMCGVWIALEDVEPGSGPLVYHPGSHRLADFTMRHAGVDLAVPSVADYQRTWAPRFAEHIAASGLGAKELLIPKGHAFVWAANLAHGGSPIERPASTRRSLVVHCYFEDSVYFTPMVSDMAAGRLAVRLPPDIRTGGWRWPRRTGKRVGVGWKTLAAAVLRDLQNRPFVS